MEIINGIHTYMDYQLGDPVKINEKFSYALEKGRNGDWEFGKISKGKWFEYPDRYFATMKYSNGTRDEVIDYIKRSEGRYGDSVVEIIDEIDIK